MSIRNEPRPLLWPEHFVVGDLRMTSAGLSFDTRVTTDERETSMLGFIDSDTEPSDVLDRLPERAATRCTLHPMSPSAPALRKRLLTLQAQAYGPAVGGASAERMNVGYGLPKGEYPLEWTCQRDDGDLVEGQHLTVVAFQGRSAVGYAGLQASVRRDKQGKRVLFYVEASLVYVAPQFRGQGYGLDLSLACGQLVRELGLALCRACPRGWRITPMVHADYESTGGESFVAQLAAELEVLSDEVSDFDLAERGTDIVFDSVELDAGY